MNVIYDYFKLFFFSLFLLYFSSTISKKNPLYQYRNVSSLICYWRPIMPHGQQQHYKPNSCSSSLKVEVGRNRSTTVYLLSAWVLTVPTTATVCLDNNKTTARKIKLTTLYKRVYTLWQITTHYNNNNNNHNMN